MRSIGCDPPPGLALRRYRPGPPSGWPWLRVCTRVASGLPTHAGCLARWAGTSVSLAAEAWQLSQRGIARRGGKVRHLWDLRLQSANQAVANPGLADVLGVCPLCGHCSCSQTHILCNCPGLTEERASLHHDLTLLAARIPRGPRRNLARAFQRLLFHDPGIANHGQLWTGL